MGEMGHDLAFKSLGKSICRCKRKNPQGREKILTQVGECLWIYEDIFGCRESICGQRKIIHRHREIIYGHRGLSIGTEHLWTKGELPETLGEHF